MKQRNLDLGRLLVVPGVDISQCLPHDIEAAADIFPFDETILRLQSKSSVSLVGSLRAYVTRTHLGIRKTRREIFRSWPEDGAVYHYDVAVVFDPKVRIRTVPKTTPMSAVDAKAEISMLTRRHPASWSLPTLASHPPLYSQAYHKVYASYHWQRYSHTSFQRSNSMRTLKIVINESFR